MATKKSAAKKAAPKAAAKKPAAKAPAKKAAGPMKPIGQALSKSGLVAHVAEHSGVEARSVKAVIGTLEQTIIASLNKKGAKAFVWPGFFKATVVSVPARPARKGINPFTKQEQVFAAKPASTKIKMRVLKKAQEAARG